MRMGSSFYEVQLYSVSMGLAGPYLLSPYMSNVQPTEDGNFTFFPCRSKLGRKSPLFISTCLLFKENLKEL